MELIAIRQTLLWCTVINYALLIFWWLTVALKWQWPYEFSARVFKIPRERVDTINFAGIVFYKAAIILFNLVPLIALYIVRTG